MALKARTAHKIKPTFDAYQNSARDAMLAFLSAYPSKSFCPQKGLRLRRYPVRRTVTMSFNARRFYAIEPLKGTLTAPVFARGECVSVPSSALAPRMRRLPESHRAVAMLLNGRETARMSDQQPNCTLVDRLRKNENLKHSPHAHPRLIARIMAGIFMGTYGHCLSIRKSARRRAASYRESRIGAQWWHHEADVESRVSLQTLS